MVLQVRQPIRRTAASAFVAFSRKSAVFAQEGCVTAAAAPVVDGAGTQGLSRECLARFGTVGCEEAGRMRSSLATAPVNYAPANSVQLAPGQTSASANRGTVNYAAVQYAPLPVRSCPKRQR
jgi:hypothetical protein